VCILHLPALVLLLKLVQSHRRPRLLRDYVFLALPCLLTTTVFANAGYLSLLLITLSDVYIYRTQNKGTSDDIPAVNTRLKSFEINQDVITDKSYLSLFKGNTTFLRQNSFNHSLSKFIVF
jgi:hypothetical protein